MALQLLLFLLLLLLLQVYVAVVGLPDYPPGGPSDLHLVVELKDTTQQYVFYRVIHKGCGFTSKPEDLVPPEERRIVLAQGNQILHLVSSDFHDLPDIGQNFYIGRYIVSKGRDGTLTRNARLLKSGRLSIPFGVMKLKKLIGIQMDNELGKWVIEDGLVQQRGVESSAVTLFFPHYSQIPRREDRFFWYIPAHDHNRLAEEMPNEFTITDELADKIQLKYGHI